MSKRDGIEQGLLGEHHAEVLLPGEHLRGEAHDQQQRLAVGVADLLVGELDAVGPRQPLVAENAHPTQSSQRTGWTARS